ncbi:MAG: alpha amylase C-terminal domain-containing protein [Desulfobacterales bacterium]|jgi:1,4-alpha-glucan branching enzyme|nr:alpha amylase C-terminal domain-containing protein [Desulfobacterales bacterium]
MANPNAYFHHIKRIVTQLVEKDPLLGPHEPALRRRLIRIDETAHRLTDGKIPLAEFASGHEYFGLHLKSDHWVFREWAPNAESVYIISSRSGWEEKSELKLKPINAAGVWEILLPKSFLNHLDLYRLRIYWPGGSGDRIPAYARRVVQDPGTLIFNAQVWAPETPYHWRHPHFTSKTDGVLIYEAHVGMAQEKEGIGTYEEFRKNILPRIVRSGYNTIQLMAIQEHPYYASFGYHVSSFFAASSRFGTPDELKALIDDAHGAGIAVVMDLIHSHAVSNEVEGLSRFDGTLHQYFHGGTRGNHRAWDSRCFDYGKIQVLHFLLSNCRFWLDEYHVDGFRFDGITSMLYLDHGLEKIFTGYDDYFKENVDEDALVYLALANKVIHSLRPDAMTIAEDISGMPGLALPEARGGFGFDYRFAMGIPDYWIKLTKETPDEDWRLGHLWFELNNRRADEKSISYAESHDQALVGDQTLIFRMVGGEIYDHMCAGDKNLRVDRGMALHKIIRLITLATAGHGYLNFMGNEFGHPEWIDFPREGNGWSYQFALRQWRLADDPNLKYRFLARFDRDMIVLTKEFGLLGEQLPELLHEHSGNKIIAFKRSSLIFAFNFHSSESYADYRIPAPAGKYQMILNSDDVVYGGHNRVAPYQIHFTRTVDNQNHILSLYLPTRTAIVLNKAD